MKTNEEIYGLRVLPTINDRRKDVYEFTTFFLEKYKYKLTDGSIKWFNKNISKINNDKIIAGASVREFSSTLIIYYKSKNNYYELEEENLYYTKISKPVKINKFQGGQ